MQWIVSTLGDGQMIRRVFLYISPFISANINHCVNWMVMQMMPIIRHIFKPLRPGLAFGEVLWRCPASP